MPLYREISPPPALASAVECLWTIQAADAGEPHRVIPDGCADILFTRSAAGAKLEAVGPMTRYRDHAILPGQLMVGVRFRPGRWPAAAPIADGIVPLEDLLGSRARRLLERLMEAGSAAECAAMLAAALPAAGGASPVQQAISWMERARGCVSIDAAASHASISPRQFRRVCVELTGLTPKFLAQVLRFRHAHTQLASGASATADLALDCGYYDQAHFIHECRRFAGRTPTMAVFSNPARQHPR